MQVTIKDVLGDQLRLAYSDSVYADLDVGADGVLTITPTGEALELVATVGVGSLGVGGVVVVTTARVLQNVTANAAILTAGTLDDARVAESNVTQHQGALSIGWGQITGAPSFLDQAAADLLYAPLGHAHDAGDIETGTLPLERGGTGLGALGDPLQILRVNAGGTGLEYATSVTDAFAKIGNGAGVEQFAASGADMLRFAAGSDLAVAFDEATNKITFSYVGGGSGGITSAYTELAVGATSATATGADTATFAAAGNGLAVALDAGTKTVTYTLDEAALSIAASQLTGTLPDTRVAASNVTQHQAALSILTTQLSGTLLDATVAASNVTQHQAALSIGAAQITGTLDGANGGTGVDASVAAHGALLIGNGSGFSLATLTAGEGIAVTNTAGGIEVAATVGAVRAARYTTSAGQSIPSGVATIVNYGTKNYDTDNAVTTGAAWKFTVPTDGLYHVDARLLLNTSTGWADGEALRLDLYVNGAVHSYMYYNDSTASSGAVFRHAQGSLTAQFVAGDELDIRVTQNSGAALTVFALAAYNAVNIEYLGTV